MPRCRIDAWVDDGDLLDERAATDLEKLAPFGAGHPEPVFALRAAAARARTVGAAGVHLKLSLGRRGSTPSASAWATAPGCAPRGRSTPPSRSVSTSGTGRGGCSSGCAT